MDWDHREEKERLSIKYAHYKRIILQWEDAFLKEKGRRPNQVLVQCQSQFINTVFTFIHLLTRQHSYHISVTSGWTVVSIIIISTYRKSTTPASRMNGNGNGIGIGIWYQNRKT